MVEMSAKRLVLSCAIPKSCQKQLSNEATECIWDLIYFWSEVILSVQLPYVAYYFYTGNGKCPLLPNPWYYDSAEVRNQYSTTKLLSNVPLV